jgi:hypothetical protein
MKFLRTPEHKRLMKMLTMARKNKGLTQQQLAEAIGENQNFISKYESGERRAAFVIQRPPRVPIDIGFDDVVEYIAKVITNDRHHSDAPLLPGFEHCCLHGKSTLSAVRWTRGG